MLRNSGTTLLEVVRRETDETVSKSFEQPLNGTLYQVELDHAAIAGTDDAERTRALQYYARALLDGNVDKLLATASVRYLSSDGLEFGSTTLEFICLLKINADSESGAAASASGSQKVTYFAINKAAYSALRRHLVSTSLKGDDSLTLQAISLLTTGVSDTPALREDAATEFETWLDRKTRGDDAPIILATIQKYFGPLFDFPLSIPEFKTVKIAGNLTMTAPTGVIVQPRDFLDVEIIAECSFENAPTRNLAFRFNDPSKITDATAPFSLTAESRLFANGLSSPVVVRARSLGADVWSKEFAADDSKLANLDIRIPKPKPRVRSRPPADTRDAADKKLRGRVLTLNQDCELKDVLVMIQAKAAATEPWKVVGAATTDGSGNFAIPYPYGTYVTARAMVSISPKETADIPASGQGNESIADDFLYLLLANPECPVHGDHEDCGCSTTEKPKRLPDHSDLIGSDVYSAGYRRRLRQPVEAESHHQRIQLPGHRPGLGPGRRQLHADENRNGTRVRGRVHRGGPDKWGHRAAQPHQHRADSGAGGGRGIDDLIRRNRRGSHGECVPSRRRRSRRR